MLVTYMKRLIDQPSVGRGASRVEVMSIALATNTVTVNGQGVYHKGEYFRKELSVNNAAGPVWQQVDVTAPNETTVTRHELVPQTPETFAYDADGNLTSDSLWTNVWNAENRLVLTESAAGVPSAARMRETWTYLPDGRWIERIVSTNNGSTYYPAGTNRYVWDGQVLLAILDHTNGVVMSFLRGLDLSGTIQGAGGVGGVLAVTFRTNGTQFVGYDGNGNVAALTDASTGAHSAVFEYGPFGEPLRVTGPAAAAMPLRFSTMYEDDVTGDRKYRFREYRPSLGRWFSRDPIVEVGGLNLYGFVSNDPIGNFDPFGLCEGGACGGSMMAAISLPSLPTHKSFCTWLEGKIRSYLHTAEERQGWDNFVGAGGKDIQLSDDQMRQVLSLAYGLQEEIKNQEKACQRAKWDEKKTDVGDFIGNPWALSLGRVAIKLTTHCNCGTLTWVACIDDLYNFDPTWFSGARSRDAEWKTILVWAAQNASGCGWKEFRYKGCGNGFGSSPVQF